MNNTSQLVTVQNNQPVTTSLIIAEGTQNEHKSIIRLISNHRQNFERWGEIRFSDLKSTNPLGGRPTQVAYLNEQQATFLITLLRNNDIVLAFKGELVDQFYKMRNMLTQGTCYQMSTRDILKHQLSLMLEHDEDIQNIKTDMRAVNADISTLTDCLDETTETADRALTTANEAIKKIKEETSTATYFETQISANVARTEDRVDSLEDSVEDIKDKLVDIQGLPETVSVDIRNCISMMIDNLQKYQNMSTKQARTQASEDLYADISRAANHMPSFVASRRKKGREELIKHGYKESTARQKVTAVTVIDADPVLKAAALQVIRSYERTVQEQNRYPSLVL